MSEWVLFPLVLGGGVMVLLMAVEWVQDALRDVRRRTDDD